VRAAAPLWSKWCALRVRIPNNWSPRQYQRPAWDYLENGGRHAELIWHRRSGKDEVALHRACVAAFERPATYWHMLPEAAQARKAIWEAVNPHTGIRRIDEAFPMALRATTREQEMLIKFANGATWQVVGSDNFSSLVGSPPAGIVYSEWALANPSARAYLRPILAENGGWQLFITTPRGKNHAHTTYQAARKTPWAFAQILRARDTGIFDEDLLAFEKAAYIADFGEDMGVALYEQEYECSFEAAILGAYYGKELTRARVEGRIRSVPYDPETPVRTAWDLGFSDDVAIWFYQIKRGEIHVIDYESFHTQDVEYCHKLLVGKGYRYYSEGKKPVLFLPHDARAKTFAARGKSVEQQFIDLGYIIRIVPSLSLQDGIQAARKTLPRCWFDEEACATGIDALGQYQREWDDKTKCFRNTPRHDWTSHPADAFRYLSIMWQQEAEPKPKGPLVDPRPPTFNQLMKMVAKRREMAED